MVALASSWRHTEDLSHWLRANGVVAGLPVAELVLHVVDPQLTFTPLVADGTPATPGQRLAVAAGLVLFVLTLIVNAAARWFVNRGAHGKRTAAAGSAAGVGA